MCERGQESSGEIVKVVLCNGCKTLTSVEDVGVLLLGRRPLFLVMLLVWRHARHWAFPARLAAIMRESINDLLASAAAYMPGGLDL